MLQPTMERKERFWVLGIQERANPMEVDYQAFWTQFEQHMGAVAPMAVEEPSS